MLASGAAHEISISTTCQFFNQFGQTNKQTNKQNPSILIYKIIRLIASPIPIDEISLLPYLDEEKLFRIPSMLSTPNNETEQASFHLLEGQRE